MALRYARELCRARVVEVARSAAALVVATSGAAGAAAVVMVVVVGHHDEHNNNQHDDADPSPPSRSNRIMERLLNYCHPARLTKCLLEDQQQQQSKDDDGGDRHHFQLEIDFLDKLAAKSYLQQHSSGGGGGGGASSIQQQDDGNNRPEAVPPALRLLAINVPELTQSSQSQSQSSSSSSRFLSHGECRLALHQTYPDAVVPPKPVPIEVHHQHQEQQQRRGRRRRNSSSSKTVELPVEQKALVKQLWQCYHHDHGGGNHSDGAGAGAGGSKLGVQIMAADMLRLNPRRLEHPLRQTLLRHYVTKSHRSSSSNKKKKKKTTRQFQEHIIQWDNNRDDDYDDEEDDQAARITLDDELEAPWHQHAWVSELQLRLQGQVPFGAALDPIERRPKRWPWLWWFIPWFHHKNSDKNNPHRKFTYAATVPSRRRWRDYLLLWWFHSLPDEAGRDGRDARNFVDVADEGDAAATVTTCWAAQRPHAVIADGGAVQQVSPRALRLLQKTCHDNHIPLYVLHREHSEFPFTRRSSAWGSHDRTDATTTTTTTTTTTRIPPHLGAALRDLRHRLKRRIVRDQLRRAAGSAFARGRSLGQWETAVQWRAAQAAAAVRQMQQRRREHNWRHLSAPQLQEELRQRGVVTFVKTTATTGTKESSRHFSNALQTLLEDYCQQQQTAAKPNDTAHKDGGDEPETTPATADDDDEI